jgi:hypothetical protein
VQIDNETYLRRHEAIALVMQLRGCSWGWGTGLVESAIKSGKVRTHEGGAQNFRRHAGDPPAQKTALVNKTDLLYWLDQLDQEVLLAPSPSTSAQRISKQIREIVAEYFRTDANPTSDGAWEYAKNKGAKGQKAVRYEYSNQAGRPGPGRRRKQSVRK